MFAGNDVVSRRGFMKKHVVIEPGGTIYSYASRAHSQNIIIHDVNHVELQKLPTHRCPTPTRDTAIAVQSRPFVTAI